MNSSISCNVISQIPPHTFVNAFCQSGKKSNIASQPSTTSPVSPEQSISLIHLQSGFIIELVPGIPNGINKIWRANDWNKIKVKMVGEIPKVTVWLKDTLLYSVQQVKNDFIGRDIKGSIGLQCHWTSVYSNASGKGMHLDSWPPGSKHRYRNIRIKEL